LRNITIAHSNRRRPRGISTEVLRVIFTLVFAATTTVAHAQTYTVLYNFGTNAGAPSEPEEGVLAQGRHGNLHGTTPIGGANGVGAVFGQIAPDGTLVLLYSLDTTTGSYPQGGLTLGTDNNFYGVTYGGGTFGYGTIYKVRPTGSSYTVLYNFTGGSDGALPAAPPVQGTDGNFYGTAAAGGSCAIRSQGCGTVYKVTSSGSFTLLHQFDGIDGDGPGAPLVQGTDGKFYGTTGYGGNTTGDKACQSGAPGCGVIFKITRAGKLTVLHNFRPSRGQNPSCGLLQGSNGSFYGTTLYGGAAGAGVIFEITPAGDFTVLHNMDGAADGAYPYASLVEATDGNFYGVAAGGGGNSSSGTFFKISLQGAFSVVYNFGPTTGAQPLLTPFQDTNGIMYGATEIGGTGTYCPTSSEGCGVFYSLNLGLTSFVRFLPPQSAGKVGKAIGIFGQGFTGTTGVSFNGTPANFRVVSDTYMTATVPSGATTGFVTVTTPSGKLTSNVLFRVIP
jgi:uncharacterized repeat protein (TIGR03803 family)